MLPVIILLVYFVGFIVFVIGRQPSDAWEGGVALLTGLIWPVIFIGWLISRPFA